MKRKLTAVALGLVLAVSATACNHAPVSAEVRKAQPYYSVSYDVLGGEDVMPIGVWWGPYASTSGSTVNGITQPDYVTDEIFTLLKESGANFIACSADQYPDAGESIQKTLELCEKYGIGYFIQDSRILNAETAADIENYAADYITHNNCLGIHLTDEPFISEIDALGPVYKAFAETSFAADKQIYVNMLPSYSGTDRLGGTHYSYLTKFVQTTGTEFLSYDNYPFRSKDQGTTYSIPSSYFEDLSTVRKVAEENHIPYWVFVQAGGQWEEQVGKPSNPLFPNEGETLWNINTCLAYGAKSIQYFTFLQPTHFADAGNDNYDYQRNGMIGVMGNKTQWYYYIQKANIEIAAIDHVLMKSAHMGVLATGFWKDRLAADIPEDSDGNSWRELQGLSSTGEDAGAIVGCFDYNFEGDKSRSAFYVVNSDSSAKQQISLNFNNNYRYEVIQRGKSVTVSGTDITLTLERGEGALIVLQ